MTTTTNTGFEIQEPINTIPTDPEELKAAFKLFLEKYTHLVWYARSRSREMMEEEGTPENIIQGALNAQAKVEERFVDEIDELCCPETGDWTHGFNSGALATIRFVLSAMESDVFYNLQSDDPNETYSSGGVADAEAEFPFLDC